jgi:hypothetical protein
MPTFITAQSPLFPHGNVCVCEHDKVAALKPLHEQFILRSVHARLYIHAVVNQQACLASAQLAMVMKFFQRAQAPFFQL